MINARSTRANRERALSSVRSLHAGFVRVRNHKQHSASVSTNMAKTSLS